MVSNIVASGAAAATIVAVIVAAGVVAGGQDPPQETAVQTERIMVFATFFPYYEFTKNVAGDRATVEQFVPAGVPAHDWDPRPSKIRSLQDVDVFVYNGLGVEPYMENIIDSDEFDHILFVKASENVGFLESGEHTEEFREGIIGIMEELERKSITLAEAFELIDSTLGEHGDDGHGHGEGTIEQIGDILHGVEDGSTDAEAGLGEIRHMILSGEEDGHGHVDDPHIWLDPVLVKQQVDNIRDGLASADPANAEHYERNAAAYNARLDGLDESIRSNLSGCQTDTFVPFHNAFAYFAQRYGLTASALGGLSPDAEASALEIAEFVGFVEENGIRVVFAEDLIDPRLAEVIADEAGAQVMVLSTVEALTLQEASDGVTFLDKMEQNLESLKVALGCP